MLEFVVDEEDKFENLLNGPNAMHLAPLETANNHN